MSETAIAVGDEVFYPASNPGSRFLARVTAIDADGLALCEPVIAGAPLFKCRLSDLRPNRTEGS